MELYYEIVHSGFLGKYLYSTESIFGNSALYYGLYISAIAVCAIIAYFIGCINFGIILSKTKYHDDIRTKGSGNAGATNMLRTCGKKMAAMTFFGDFFKAVIAVLIGICIMGGMGGYAAAFFCMVGHAFPCFYGFKGGKGVAVTAGAIFVLNYVIFLILLAVFVIAVWATRFISLGSVTAFFLFPLLLSHMNTRMPSLVMIFAVMMAVLGIYLHRENIKRIYDGKENKFSLKSKKADSGDGNDK